MENPSPDPPDQSPELSKKELIQRRLDESLERLARFEREMPRLMARIAAGLTDGKNSPPPPAPVVPKPDDRVAALEKMLYEEQHRRVRTERENKVRAAVAAVPWVDPEDAVHDLMSKVEDRDGRLVISETHGDPFAPALPLEEAVKQLAQTKQHWVKAELKGGSGASGGTASRAQSSSLDWDGIKYRDLKANPVLMQRAIGEKGSAWVASLHDKWRQKQAGKQTLM